MLLSNPTMFSLWAQSLILQEVILFLLLFPQIFIPSTLYLNSIDDFASYFTKNIEEYWSLQKKISSPSNHHICQFICVYLSLFWFLSFYSAWIGPPPSICTLDSIPSTTEGLSSCSNSFHLYPQISLSYHSHQLTTFKHTIMFLILENLTQPHICISPPFLYSSYSKTPQKGVSILLPMLLYPPFPPQLAPIRSYSCQGHPVARPVTNPHFSSYLTTQ